MPVISCCLLSLNKEAFLLPESARSERMHRYTSNRGMIASVGGSVWATWCGQPGVGGTYRRGVAAPQRDVV